MNASTKILEKRLAQLKAEVPTRGFERFPSIINSLAELPGDLCSPLLEEKTGQTMILFPPQIQRGRHYVPRQALLLIPTEITHVLASIWPGEPPQVSGLQCGNLLFVKISLLLLYGCLEIAAQGPEAPISLTLEFNTVAWDKLAMPLRRFIQAGQPTPVPLEAESTISRLAQPGVKSLPLKFSNGVYFHGLLPGETLEELVFQPGVTERHLLLFHRALIANTLLLLTTNYVSVIQEHLLVAQGWIITYIPRQNITSILCRPTSQWSDITFRLARQGQATDYTLRLNAEASQAWKSVWERNGGAWEDLPAMDPQ